MDQETQERSGSAETTSSATTDELPADDPRVALKRELAQLEAEIVAAAEHRRQFAASRRWCGRCGERLWNPARGDHTAETCEADYQAGRRQPPKREFLDDLRTMQF